MTTDPAAATDAPSRDVADAPGTDGAATLADASAAAVEHPDPSEPGGAPAGESGVASGPEAAAASAGEDTTVTADDAAGAADGVDDAAGTGTPEARPAPVPAADVARDVVAALLLVTSLALPWSIRSFAADHAWAVVAVVVALLALPLPYLARAGVLPGGWSVRTTRLARLVAAAPFVVVTVVYGVLDIARGTTSALDRGIGTAIGLGLAGALLVAQPRACELGPDDQDVAAPRGWRTGLVVVGGLIAAGAVAAFAISLAGARHVSGSDVLLALCLLLLPLVLGALPAFGAVCGDAAWAATLAGVGAAAAVLFVVGAGSSVGLLQVESFHASRFGLVLLPAAAAIAAGAAFRRTLGTLDLRAAVTRTLLVLALLGLVTALTRVVAIVRTTGSSGLVVPMVVGFLLAVLAGVALVALRTPGTGARYLALVVAVAAVVLGTAAVGVVASHTLGNLFDVAMLAYGVPAVLLVLLALPAGRAWTDELRTGRESAYTWVPAPARTGRPAAFAVPAAQPRTEPERAPERAAAPGARPEHSSTGAAVLGGAAAVGAAAATHGVEPAGRPADAEATGVLGVTQPVQEQEQAPDDAPAPEPVARRSSWDAGATPAARHDAEPEPDVSTTAVLPAEAGFTATQALDPSTPLEVLAQIAEHAPSLRPYVAQNPSTYPALLDWLGALGDPAVDDALRRRGGR